MYLWHFGLCGFYSPYLHCLNENAFMGYGAIGINGWPLLSTHSYLSVGAHTLLLSCLCH